MRTTPFICQISTINHEISRSLESLTFHADSRQFLSAATELGRMRELANRLAAVCRSAGDALWEDERDGREKG